MRLVKRQEFMQLPAGTLFAPMQQKWVFGDLAVKGDTSQHGNEIGDFLELGLNWIDGDDTGQVCDRLDEMLADSSVSYPLQSAYSREGLFDNDMVLSDLRAARRGGPTHRDQPDATTRKPPGLTHNTCLRCRIPFLTR